MSDKMRNDVELSLGELEGANGGAFINGKLVAYCRKCKRQLQKVRDERRGGATSIWICVDPKCSEHLKEKTNDQVDF